MSADWNKGQDVEAVGADWEADEEARREVEADQDFDLKRD